ncbi:MAG: serine/threonine-protein phosphatase [Betaproteobacteria bacterium]|nr:serine/threonine-protein phosphatase [Betaproteobacteria bacterium]
MKFSIFQDSRVGARPYNQDRIGYWYTRDALLMLVADGMGGHLLGEVAAQIALDQLAGDFQREARPRLADPDGFLFNGVSRVQNAILRYARDNNLPDTPRTTLVVCVVQDGHAWWTHIGDSRLYLVRRGRIVARTKDHTRVQQLVDQGRIREEAVSSHPERNRLLQALGGVQAPSIEPTASARLARDDILLLCSDGFWGPLTQRQFLGSLLSRDLMQAVPELMTLAESRAGPECDNVSVVAMNWGEDEVSSPDTLSPATVPFHDMPTDVQDFTATDPEFGRQHMSDEDIERAIAEIRDALKKHHPPRT